jgi:hypothetical protein
VPNPPLAPIQVQQRVGELAGPVPRPSVFSQLDHGQSSSSGAIQGLAVPPKVQAPRDLRKAPM